MLIHTNKHVNKNTATYISTFGVCIFVYFVLSRETLNPFTKCVIAFKEYFIDGSHTVLYHVQLPVTNNNSEFDDFVITRPDNQIQNFKTFEENFNFTKCQSQFKIYTYPLTLREKKKMSPIFKTILATIHESRYYSKNASEACLFLLTVDTVNRDINGQYYVLNVDKKLESLPYWNNGTNHLVFVLFSGTRPYYNDNELNFTFGNAMLIKASASLEKTRIGYDISIPLLPKKELFSNTSSHFKSNDTIKRADIFPLRRKFLLVFKGKRYLYGVGRKSRNMLRLICNSADIVLLTTCKHGDDWESYKDEHCYADNRNYNKYDYEELLTNSTFCLVPRGRRLGSFRFLEVMKYGCIPVLLSNGWDLPFSEVLDWSKFSINIDERMILRTPYILRDINEKTILAMKQHVIFIWESYFSSMKTITATVMELLKGRIYPHKRQPYLVWNSFPGALKVSFEFSPSLTNYPFYGKALGTIPSDKFTAIVMAVTPVFKTSSPLFKLIKIINTSKCVNQIVVIWLSHTNIPTKLKRLITSVPLRIIQPKHKTMNERFAYMDNIKTDAIFTFDDDVQLASPYQLDFAYSVWRSNPSRLVGFNVANHVYDMPRNKWKYTSRTQSQFSMVSMTSAIFHRYYCHYYKLYSPKSVLELVEREKTCESIAMNFLVSFITNHPPIKVTNNNKFIDGNHIKPRLGRTFKKDEYMETQQKCFDELVRVYSGIPLVHSKVSANPLS